MRQPPSEARLHPPHASIDASFRAEVLRGLALPQPTISPRWFYDDEGSRLFEALTDLPEYYPTRTERTLLIEQGPAIAQAVGPGRTVVEYGAGALSKTPLLLSSIQPRAYVPIDIAGEFLRASAQALHAQFPELPIHPVEADFTQPVRLPPIAEPPLLGFFPGSTLGNLLPEEAVALLQRMGRTLGPGAQLLIGLDRAKDPAILIPAYDDAQGKTAAFNRHLLERINHELEGTIPVEAFAHRAIWNADASRIEMHLVAQRAVTFDVVGQRFAFQRGQHLHTENSHKYTPVQAEKILSEGGWRVRSTWTDPEDWFALILAERKIGSVERESWSTALVDRSGLA